MIYILFQSGHDQRAQALSLFTNPSLCKNIDLISPRKIWGLVTLTFWGHGDAMRFCGYDVKSFVQLLRRWKKKNSTLKTIELISCNLRHCSSASSLSFFEQLKLNSRFSRSVSSLQIKSLPMSLLGPNKVWSILLAEVNFTSWCYITAPGNDDKLLMEVVNQLCFTESASGIVSYKGSLIERAEQVVRRHQARGWTLNYGHLRFLRRNLTNI